MAVLSRQSTRRVSGGSLAKNGIDVVPDGRPPVWIVRIQPVIDLEYLCFQGGLAV